MKLMRDWKSWEFGQTDLVVVLLVVGEWGDGGERRVWEIV
jgi:hypothetical protein